MRRRSSISSADALAPHDHVAWYGEGSDDLYALASTALAQGARRAEKLIFVADAPDPARLRAIDQLDRLLDSGQLELFDIGAVYGTSLAFSHTRQLATFEVILANALAEGFTGIRVVADNTALAAGDEDSFRRWMCWEQLTDRFQSNSNVTGVCYFDRGALSDERQADLASLHPVRSPGSVRSAFSFFVDGDAASIRGTVDTWSAERFLRVLSTTPDDRPLVVDLSGAEFVDHHALLALGAAASATRPVRVRRARPIVHELRSLLEISTPHLQFEQ